MSQRPMLTDGKSELEARISAEAYARSEQGDVVGMDLMFDVMNTINWCNKRIDRLEVALHRIAGHANITAKKAREIAAEAVEKTDQ